MKTIVSIVLVFCISCTVFCQAEEASSPADMKAYYTRLAFEDNGFSGKHADIEMGTDGSYSLAIWMKYAATKSVSFEISK